METNTQQLLTRLLSLSLKDRLDVIERVLRSVSREYQHDLNDAINEVLYKDTSTRSMAKNVVLK
jgi:hypothetical protein